MESVDRLRRELDSLEELRDIVKTMKALSATSIRQYERAVAALADYYRTVERGLHVVLGEVGVLPYSVPDANEERGVAAIVFGSDHGLCGRFNEELAAHTLERLGSVTTATENRRVLAVGARAAASLDNEGQRVEQNLIAPGSAAQITTVVQQILLDVNDWLESGSVHYVYLFFNRRVPQGGYHSTSVELLPLQLQRFRRLEEERWPSRNLPTFTMDTDSLLRMLLHQYLFVMIFRACAESQASEHASRLAAMQSAERSLDNRRDEVTMSFRRARQTAITSELLDVVAGFEAITAEQSRD